MTRPPQPSSAVEREKFDYKVGCAPCAPLAKKQECVGSHGLIERHAEFLPCGQQLFERTGVHHRARENVRAWLATFLNHRNRSPWVQLFGADGGGQARGTASHDHEVLVPRCFRNHGNYVISFGDVVKWLAQHAQELGAFGGGFIYHHERNRVSLGFVVGLDYRNPWRSPYEEFQR